MGRRAWQLLEKPNRFIYTFIITEPVTSIAIAPEMHLTMPINRAIPYTLLLGIFSRGNRNIAIPLYVYIRTDLANYIVIAY